MRWKQSIAAATVAIGLAAYITYLRTPAFVWRAPSVKNTEVRATEEFNVYFKILSRENCPLIITRYAEYTGASGGIVQLPALRFEQKVIKASPDERESHFPVSFPAGTEPRKYRIFSRFLINNCTWLDRLWPRIIDSEPVEVTLVP